MKVLLVNQYYPPDGAATAVMAAGAAARLAARGHAVSVLAGRPSYDVATSMPWRPVTTQHADGVTVRRVGSTAFERTRMAGRLANYISYATLATPFARGAVADVVVGMSDPPFAGVLAHSVAKARKRPFVYWMQDVHPDFALATGELRPSGVIARWQRLHGRALAGANTVVVLGDDMVERAVSAGAHRGRVRVVRSGAPLDVAAPAADHGRIAERIRAERAFVVVHAGNLGQASAWRTLIDGVHRSTGDVGLAFVGPGAERAAAERAAGDDPRVRFFDYWPAADAAHVFAAGDLHAVTVRRGLEGLVVPSRLYAILAAGRPVLAVADAASDVAALVTRHECGLVADPDDAGSVAAAIDWALAHPDELAAMGARARSAAQQYDRLGLLDELVDIIEAAAQ